MGNAAGVASYRPGVGRLQGGLSELSLRPQRASLSASLRRGDGGGLPGGEEATLAPGLECPALGGDRDRRCVALGRRSPSARARTRPAGGVFDCFPDICDLDPDRHHVHLTVARPEGPAGEKRRPN